MKYSISPVNHYNKFVEFTSKGKTYMINTNPVAEFKDSAVLSPQAHIQVTKEYKEFYDERGYLIFELVDDKTNLLSIKQMKTLNSLAKWYKINPIVQLIKDGYLNHKTPTKDFIIQDFIKGVDNKIRSLGFALYDTISNYKVATLLLLFLICFIAISITKDNVKPIVETTVEDTTFYSNNPIVEEIPNDSTIEANKIQQTKSWIENELTSDLLNNKSVSNYYDIPNIIGYVGSYKLYTSYINDTELYDDQELKKLGKQLSKKVSVMQKRELPKIRKSYVNIINEKLFRYNIEVFVSGKNNTTITFVGGAFANNANVIDTQTELSEMFHLLRFKRVNYKWYSGDDEYTYYTLNTDSDGSLY